ncbi:hypothetical protein [Gordonia sp. (in: high G+C Gram-positive bacteria)]|uniref:hypothetical protein n=1 Tax=Gordonia sp. (in: high G+C Gram-positive bacteria) TaxID=84139 RepID=UPI003526DCFF
MTAWVEVLIAMVDGPSVPVTGVVETVDDDDGFRMWMGEIPVFVGLPPGAVRVWQHGRRLRVDLPDGTPVFRRDGEHAWRFDPSAPAEPPVLSPGSRVEYTGPGRAILAVRDANDWARSDDFTRPTKRPIEETEFLGRPAWAVELAAPERKPYPIRLVVDRETGAVLEMRNDDAGVRASYVRFATADVEPGWFRYDGPVTAVAERDADLRREWEQRRKAEQDWFTEHVGPAGFALPLTVPFGQLSVHRRDDDGGFEASTRSAAGHVSLSLARRPRSSEPWDLHWPDESTRWSDDDYDWAACIHGFPLDDAAAAVLRRTFARRTPVGPGD